MVGTRTRDTTGTDPGPARLVHYQIADHLDSARLELDHQGLIISYEEYAPFGSSTYQAVRNQTEAPKRYRYAGKERDETRRAASPTTGRGTKRHGSDGGYLASRRAWPARRTRMGTACRTL
jgi:hypothetical protein